MRGVVAIALLLVAARAGADPVAAARARLDAGMKRYEAQDYRGAIAQLVSVTRDVAAPRALRARAYEALGMAELILGREALARESFEDLLAIDPHYRLNDPSKSPKLRDFFEAVRASFVPGYSKAPAEAELEHAAPAGAVAGRPIEVEATVVSGARAVAKVVVRSRRQGLLAFREEEMAGGGGRWRGSVVAPGEIADYVLEYYLEGKDGAGRVVARVGSPETPLALPVRGAPEVVPWFRRMWVWGVAAGVVAIGAGVGIGVGVGVGGKHAPEGSLGHVTLGLGF